jgi:hypothetical protein
MKRLTFIVALFLLAGLAQAGTFELSDPATEMREDQQAMGEQVEADKLASEYRAAEEAADEPAAFQVPEENILCTVDAASGACTCIDKEAAKQLSLTRDECVARVMKSLNTAEH